MTNTSLSLLLLAFTACAATPAPHTTPAPAPIATVPADWTVLDGPHATLDAACGGCQLSRIKALPTGTSFLAVAQGSRGLDSFIALQTSRGWYLEMREEMPPMHSHHEPRSLYYDIERTRVTDGAVVRMVDSQQVFYPGQGNAGTSHTSWFDRTCRVFGERVACSEPVSIATRSCERESIGNGETSERCTGAEP